MTTEQAAPVMRARKRATEVAQPVVNGSILVTASAYGVETEDRTEIPVQRFLAEPAYVRVAAGRTISMGPQTFEFVRIDIAITVPCYTEEIDTVQKRVADAVARMMEEEIQAYGLAAPAVAEAGIT